MFKVNMYWDGHKYSELYYHYKYALEAFETFSRIIGEKKDNGEIDYYYAEIIKED